MPQADEFDLYAYVAGSLQETMKEKLDDPGLKAKTAQALMGWLRNKAHKKAVPNLEARLNTMEAAVQKMCENMRIEFAEGKVVIRVNGSDEDTLKAFRLGTSWFEPNPDLVETVLTGLFDE